jgi:hypothetical protein
MMVWIASRWQRYQRTYIFDASSSAFAVLPAARRISKARKFNTERKTDMLTNASQIQRFERLMQSKISLRDRDMFGQQTPTESKEWVDSIELFFREMHREIYRAYRKREKLTLRAGRKVISYLPGK